MMEGDLEFVFHLSCQRKDDSCLTFPLYSDHLSSPTLPRAFTRPVLISCTIFSHLLLLTNPAPAAKPRELKRIEKNWGYERMNLCLKGAKRFAASYSPIIWDSFVPLRPNHFLPVYSDLCISLLILGKCYRCCLF